MTLSLKNAVTEIEELVNYRGEGERSVRPRLAYCLLVMNVLSSSLPVGDLYRQLWQLLNTSRIIYTTPANKSLVSIATTDSNARSRRSVVAMVTTYTPLVRSQVFKTCPKCPDDTGTLCTTQTTNQITGTLCTTQTTNQITGTQRTTCHAYLSRLE